MKNLNLIIGSKLKDIRLRRNLSLDDVSKLTGVSKGTVSTLWKISTGLKVSFSSFINEKEDDLKIIHQDDIVPLLEDNSRMKLYSIFPFDNNKGFEIFTIELDPGCNHVSTPHNDDVEEYIIVTEGTMELIINDHSFILQKGNSIKFMGKMSHSYKNTTAKKAVFQNIIMYYN